VKAMQKMMPFVDAAHQKTKEKVTPKPMERTIERVGERKIESPVEKVPERATVWL
jgi:hypothetical protein